MIKIKYIVYGVLAITAIIILTAITGVNDAGFRTIVQYPTGTLKVVDDPGIYLKAFGKTTVYPDFITYNFDRTDAEEESSINEDGVSVRYQDGGLGTIYGQARFALPQDHEQMLDLHKSARSANGVAFKLIKPVLSESMNLTAGLMSSEEAYAEKRAIFKDWAQTQVEKGPFVTKLTETTVTDQATGRKISKSVPERRIDEETGLAMHKSSDLLENNLSVVSFQITDWEFESRTQKQIADKREATMAIITAKAQAEKAKQDEITAEANGKAAKMKAKYEKEVEKERAVVAAEQQKEVAEIAAAQKVAVATQERLEAEQKKLTAAEYKEEQTLRGEGDSAYKRLVMQADGALEQKLATYKEVNALYAKAIASQKWVPEVSMGGGSGEGSAAVSLVDLFMVKTAKDLALDMNMSTTD